MQKKKILATLFLPLLLASFLQSQSLGDLAKKEKARRAALKGKHATVVTEADLAKVKRQPAVESRIQEQTAAERAAQAGQAEETAAGAEEAKAAAEGEKPAEETPPGETPAISEKDTQKKQAELADIAQQKAELVDLLTLKMNTLYQEFYGLDNLKSREMIQLQISDTYDKLLKAETESAKARKDLEDFLAQTKKDSVPAIWIK
ncbi:MAG: hypothetical protein A2V76_02315 [Candidatus Aminicenantes bacterium RBG_16_63_14]|nr:MAG: hypothetical protein A2V76_02315 [Candidatus Aminicenantes bacterium RBG_16_63_14]OGD28939.1 MAG: hypothetical protein A2V57_06835 [Candidatus Aminicenantes bacterium RBG_19FT_COMBO_65_30]